MFFSLQQSARKLCSLYLHDVHRSERMNTCTVYGTELVEFLTVCPVSSLRSALVNSRRFIENMFVN